MDCCQLINLCDGGGGGKEGGEGEGVGETE